MPGWVKPRRSCGLSREEESSPDDEEIQQGLWSFPCRLSRGRRGRRGALSLPPPETAKVLIRVPLHACTVLGAFRYRLTPAPWPAQAPWPLRQRLRPPPRWEKSTRSASHNERRCSRRVVEMILPRSPTLFPRISTPSSGFPAYLERGALYGVKRPAAQQHYSEAVRPLAVRVRAP